MSTVGHIHLIACRCVLPHLKSSKEPPPHRFRVFTRLVDDVPVVKYAQCNNCGLVHRVTDLGRSEITGKDEGRSVKTISDIKPLLPEKLVSILESNDADLASYELCEHVLNHQEWGRFVVLSSEPDGSITHVKILEIMGPNFFRVETEERQDTF